LFRLANPRTIAPAALSIAVILAAFASPAFCEEEEEAVLGPNSKDIEKAEQLFQKGHRALDKQDLRGAEALYRKAIELNPHDSRYHRQLVLILLTERRGHEAEREALYAHKSDPTDWKSTLVLGRVYHEENRIDEEVTLYKKLLKTLPEEQTELRAKVLAFIKKDEESVKKEKERLKKKKEWEEREFKNAY
jgi:tetratricopeptide (TPR) repeat protein